MQGGVVFAVFLHVLNQCSFFSGAGGRGGAGSDSGSSGNSSDSIGSCSSADKIPPEVRFNLVSSSQWVESLWILIVNLIFLI